MENRIKCGKCQSEYHPRSKELNSSSATGPKMDYSCPVCKHGSLGEVVQESAPKKSLLLDWAPAQLRTNGK